MIAKGRARVVSRAGVLNGRAKLSDAEVESVVVHRGWLTQGHLAEVFGITQTHVSSLQLRAKRSAGGHSAERMRGQRGAI